MDKKDLPAVALGAWSWGYGAAGKIKYSLCLKK